MNRKPSSKHSTWPDSAHTFKRKSDVLHFVHQWNHIKNNRKTIEKSIEQQIQDVLEEIFTFAEDKIMDGINANIFLKDPLYEKLKNRAEKLGVSKKKIIATIAAAVASGKAILKQEEQTMELSIEQNAKESIQFMEYYTQDEEFRIKIMELCRNILRRDYLQNRCVNLETEIPESIAKRLLPFHKQEKDISGSMQLH